jgi:hypothetical protein
MPELSSGIVPVKSDDDRKCYKSVSFCYKRVVHLKYTCSTFNLTYI